MVVNDATLVTDDVAREAILTVEQQFDEGGPDAVEDALADFEPILAKHLRREAERIAGKLALCGAPSETAQSFYFDALRLAIAGVQAMRTGHAALWSDDDLHFAERSAVALLAVGGCKLAVIKALRDATSTSLAVAKAMVDACPTVIAKEICPTLAAEMAIAVNNAGGTAEII